MKLLFWFALVVLVYWALRNKSQAASRAASEHGGHGGGRAAGSRGSGAPEPMLQCQQCNVYFPASEAMRNTRGDAFCCEEHRRAHDAR